MARKRKTLGDAGACPRYTIEIEEWHDRSGVEAKAKVGGHVVGIVSASMEADGNAGLLQVMHSHVKIGHRRCGLGTKLYTQVAQWGCERGRNLHSDSARSEYSQAFWVKQVAKGRASCVTKVPAQYHRPDLDLKPGVQNARGGCETYRLRCPVTDLSGRKR
jgi:hypothetical protein